MTCARLIEGGGGELQDPPTQILEKPRVPELSQGPKVPRGAGGLLHSHPPTHPVSHQSSTQDTSKISKWCCTFFCGHWTKSGICILWPMALQHHHFMLICSRCTQISFPQACFGLMVLCVYLYALT